MVSLGGRRLQRTRYELDPGFGVDGAAFTDGKGTTNMDDRRKVLSLLASGPQDAGALSMRLGISRNTLFSLLIKMEKEDLIEWKDREWVARPSSASKQDGRPDTSRSSESGPSG